MVHGRVKGRAMSGGKELLELLDEGMGHVEKVLGFVSTPEESEEAGEHDGDVVDAEFTEHKVEQKQIAIASETQSKMWYECSCGVGFSHRNDALEHISGTDHRIKMVPT